MTDKNQLAGALSALALLVLVGFAWHSCSAFRAYSAEQDQKAVTN